MNFLIGYAVTLTLNLKLNILKTFKVCRPKCRLDWMFRYCLINLRFCHKNDDVRWGGVGVGRLSYFCPNDKTDIVCSFIFLCRQFDYLFILNIFAMLIIFARHEYNFFKLSPPPSVLWPQTTKLYIKTTFPIPAVGIEIHTYVWRCDFLLYLNYNK